MPLSGQFRDFRDEVKESMTGPFASSLARHSPPAHLEEYLSFQMLTASSSAREFYEFYEL
jgi:hypothetical protein